MYLSGVVASSEANETEKSPGAPRCMVGSGINLNASRAKILDFGPVGARFGVCVAESSVNEKPVAVPPIGHQTVAGSGADLAAIIDRELPIWRDVVQKSDAKVE
jgi:hypothetical protein